MELRRASYLSGFLTLFATSGLHAQSLYWDANDITDGASATPTGTWGTDAFWSSDPAGLANTAAWTNGATAFFSAGTDATNSFTVTLTAGQTQTASRLVFEEGTATIAAATGATLVLTTGAILDVASGQSATISAVIGGTAGIVKSNAGTLTISANNTFTGPVIINGGKLIIPGESSATSGNPNPLGAAPAAATPNSLILSNNAMLRSTKQGVGSSFVLPNRGITLGNGGGHFEITDTNIGNYLTYGGIIAGIGALTKRGNGTYYPTGANTYTGNTTNLAGTIRIPSGSALIFGQNANTLVMAGGDFYYPFDVNRTIGNKIQIKSDTTISGTVTNSFHCVAFTNNSVISTGGTLTIRNVGGGAQNFQVRFVGVGYNFSRPIIVGVDGDNPAQLDFLNDIPAGGALADQTFSGVISGPGSMRRTCAGDGTGGRTILSGANTYTGGTTISGGHLGVGIDSTNYPVTVGPFGTGAILVGDDANDGFFSSGGAHTFGNDISFGTGTKFTVSGTNALTFYGAIDLGGAAKGLFISNTALTKISGVISGGNSFTKAGPGTLALSGNNTYSGDTLVTTGQLLVNSTNGTSSGNVIVSAGATLGGTGSISGPVTVNGILAPGANGVGALTVQNGIDLSTSSDFSWQLGAFKDNSTGSAGIDFDQLVVTGGSLALGGSSKLSINFTNAAAIPNVTNSFWKNNHTWTVVVANGSNPSLINFSILQNATYSIGYFTNIVDANGNILLNYISTYVTPPSPTISSIISAVGTTNIGLSWSSVSGGIYQVQYKNDLNASNWVLLGTVTASNSTASFIDTNAPATNRFYRLVAP